MNWYLFFDVIAWGFLSILIPMAFLDRKHLARDRNDLILALIYMLVPIAYLIARLP